MRHNDKDFDDLALTPELFDGQHQVIPIVSGGDDTIEEVNLPEVLPI